MLSRDPCAFALAEEAAENAASIRAIPDSELSDLSARQVLIAMAEAGQDVYAYVLAACDHHVVWIRPERPDLDGRHIPAEWAAQWRAQQSQEGQAEAKGGNARA